MEVFLWFEKDLFTGNLLILLIINNGRIELHNVAKIEVPTKNTLTFSLKERYLFRNNVRQLNRHLL
jgi:hypothetical protein